MEPARNVEMTVLMDFYGALLTDRQREMMRLRLEEDFSLSEIAQTCQVSRQAVNDALRKAEGTLCGMEEKLHIVQRLKLLRIQAQRATQALDQGDIQQVRRILDDMQREGVYGI